LGHWQLAGSSKISLPALQPNGRYRTLGYPAAALEEETFEGWHCYGRKSFQAKTIKTIKAKLASM